MSVNKHQAMKTWVEQFLNGEKMFFENIEAEIGARTLIPDYGDFVVKTDILGNSTKYYTFGFIAIEPLDPHDIETNNVNTRQLVDSFNDWLILQKKNGNYPDFGENASRYKIVPLQNTANMASTFPELQLAKYILMARIEYVEKE